MCTLDIANVKNKNFQASVQSLRSFQGTKLFSLVSGGVDSSVATAMAMEAGLDVTGVTMLNHEGADDKAAAALCGELDIELLTFDLRAAFEELVLAPFRTAYREGRTPNPCAVCNRTVKFGLLWDRIAEQYGSDDFNILTGHYARIERAGGETSLCRGIDTRKDQSYFLCMLPIERVRRLILPLGDFAKSEIRCVANALGERSQLFAHLAQKPDSMDICFQQEGGYRAMLPASGQPGDIVDRQGNVLGRHNGIENFTLGQRKGLGISSREPLFVVAIRPDENLVAVADRSEAETCIVTANGMNVLAPAKFRDGARLSAKIRSQSPLSPCTLSLRTDGHATATFDAPQFAPAPGQYLTLYDVDTLVAGGEIIRTDE